MNSNISHKLIYISDSLLTKYPFSFLIVSVACRDCGLEFTHLEDYETHLHQHALGEEEAQIRDNGTPPTGLDVGENGGEDMDGADQCAVSSLAQEAPSELTQGVSTDPAKNTLRNVYVCRVCGKVYMYRVSFEKHQQLHEGLQLRENHRNQGDQNLRMYECPDCGMSFIRRTRLIAHLRVHRAHAQVKLPPPKCDQCNKCFTSMKSWLAHVDLHNQRQFWCLICARGYTDEVSLDKHLQRHSLREFNTNECSHMAKHHMRDKNEHCQSHDTSSSKPLGSSSFNEKEGDIKEHTLLICKKEELEMDGNTEEQTEKDGNVQTSEGQSPRPDTDCGGFENCESDCGEPVHCFTFSRPFSCGDPSDEIKSEAGQSQTGLEQAEKEPNVHREHKYWEWECIECDMGFDEMAKLHLHYIKHATGEVPIPLDDIEG